MALTKLLVIADSLTIQKVIRLALHKENYDIETVSNAKDALEQMAMFRPQIVLIDHSLPAKAAFMIKEELNRSDEFKKTPCILMASAFEKVDETHVSSLGFEGRLVKPFDPDQLKQTLLDHIEPAHEEQTSSRIDLAPFSKDDLWDAPQISSTNTPDHAPDKTMEIVIPKKNEENDIKNLTEATIKMSGLDQFEWSVNESAAKTPPPASPAMRESTKKIILPTKEPSLAPPSYLQKKEDWTFPLETNSPPSQSAPLNEYEPEIQFESQPQIIPGKREPELQSSSTPSAEEIMPISSSEMEGMIRSQIQETLERMARQILPEVAERIIKEEIHKLLSNPPQ